MADEPIEIARAALAAFLSGDLEGLRAVVDADLEWTYLDPSVPDPQPATCVGRAQLEQAMSRWAGLALPTTLEHLEAKGDQVVAVLHAPGLDAQRARNANDRNFHLVTVRDGYVHALRACRDLAEARTLAGLAPAPETP